MIRNFYEEPGLDPKPRTFKVFLDTDDSLISGDSDERPVRLLMEKVEAYLAGR